MKEPPIQISLAQRFFACGWLLRVWLSVFSFGVPLLVFWTLTLKVVFAAAWYTWFLIVGVLLLFAFAGFLVGEFDGDDKARFELGQQQLLRQ